MARCGGKWLFLFRDNVSHPIPDGGISWLSLPVSPSWPPFPMSPQVREVQANKGDSAAPQEANTVRRVCRPVHIPEALSVHWAKAASGPASRSAARPGGVSIGPLSITFSRKGWPGMVVGGDVAGNQCWVFFELKPTHCVCLGFWQPAFTKGDTNKTATPASGGCFCICQGNRHSIVIHPDSRLSISSHP